MSTQRPTTSKNTTLDPQGVPSSEQGSSRKRKQAYNTASLGLDVTANLAEASDILAPLKAACRVTKSILNVIQAIDDNQEGWSDLVRRLEEYMSAIEHQVDSFENYPAEDRVVDKAFSQPLIHYVEFLESFYSTVADFRHKRTRGAHGVLTTISKTKLDAEVIRQFNIDIEDRHRQFMEALTLFTALRIQVIEWNTKATKSKVDSVLTDVDANAILQLPMAAFVASSVHSTCLQGTRQAVLQTIWRWAEDDSLEKSIFWLCDIAGSGKSTVAMSAAEAWRTEGMLGGQFFFSMANSEASNTGKFCSTLARDLVHHLPELAPHVAEAVKHNPSVMRSALAEQFRTLITGPLRHRQQRVILIIDAIDECKSGSQRKELLDTLVMATRESVNLKVFITSRPDPTIESVLQPLSIKAKLEDRLHDTNHQDNMSDIAVYVHRSLDGILLQDKRQRLVEKANGLFIWASTACRMLTSKSKLSPPEDIYIRLISMDQPGAIDDVYNLVFERTDPEYYVVMCEMLSLLLAAFEPLTIDDLDDLLRHSKVRGSGKALVETLGSVLTKDATTNLIQFRHPTLVEYLRRCSTIPVRENGNRIYINLANAHGQAASWCLKCLKSQTEGLKFNICQLRSSFYPNREIPNIDAKISKFIPKKLRYASSHWLFHTSETDDLWRFTLQKEVQHAIRIPGLLYWMEVLSFTGGVSRAITGLRTVTRCRIEDEVKSSMSEIIRFMMAFSVPIQESAPHIYISALPFTPKRSIMYNEAISEYNNILTVAQGHQEKYPGLPTSLQGHESSVNAVTFSSDGLRVASGSSDKTIPLWDADTGQSLGEPLRGHGNSVRAIAFSPDGSRIVSGSLDWTVRLWNADTGQTLGEPLQGHEGWVMAVAFSPDGLYIASGSEDNTLRLWDVDTGQPVGEPLRGHKDSINTVAFSPDGFRIVSGSSDWTVRLWDVNTGRAFGNPFRGHCGWVNAVAFSPDGGKFVSGSSDWTVRLWDVTTGQTLGKPFRGHNGWVNSVAFSPDGLRVVSGAYDRTIRLWNATTGYTLGEPFREHEESVMAVAFSPEGLRIVSGSSDKTIRFWDTGTGRSLGETCQGHQDWVTAVGFSPDGLQIVSGSSDNTIRLWDAETGEQLGEPLRGHNYWVNAVAFSPDGAEIVSGSYDKTIRLWSAGTGQPVGEPFRAHTDSVRAIAFSPDGSRIVSGSSDRTILLWDVETRSDNGRATSRPRKLDKRSRILARWLEDSLWVKRPQDPHLGFRNRSVEGSRIAGGLSDWTIRLWDADTGQPLGEPFRGHKDSINAIAFSPDGFRIVSGSSDWTVRLWDADTGQPLGEPLQGHRSLIRAIGFSPDGLQIVSGSDDNTIRLWDVHTDAYTNSSNQGDRDSACSGVKDDVPGTPLKILVPGFEQCTLLHDGWVQSSGKRLFWVPPDNRHGLQYPYLLLTMPTASPYRATKLDFTYFQCGSSWTNVRKGTNANR
ncbi:related to WD40-repeat protein (notchless protein) [Serendipita indica DSM 11827]|uniref:Related to WD40-repeat protein (Notchless protein) n=1 Tax=Serendipita indica (strain DSM 11827) TaxID=1109443 RepID=G4U2W7_SERID|nr:related to WD40-repeat protein (notchless protein) [Serendipita indica DSM 11827]